MLSRFSFVQLWATLWTTRDCQVPLSIEFSRQEYWSGLPHPPSRDLPNSTTFVLKKKKKTSDQTMSGSITATCSNMHRRKRHLNNGCFPAQRDYRWISSSFAYIPVISMIHTCLMKYFEMLFSHLVMFDSVTPWTAACQASLSFTISWSLLKFTSIESVMPSNHSILCHLLRLLPSIFPSSRVFSNELALCTSWPKC